MNQIKLSKRLSVIAGLIDNGSSVADIGTDHGYLPVYLALAGKHKRIIAADMSPLSLESAKRSAKTYNVTKQIEFFETPGLTGLTQKDVNTVVISGLGGETIIDILSDAPWTCNNGIKLILQPQSKLDLLCRFLYQHEYNIMNIQSLYDNKKYTVITAIGEK